MKKILMIDDNRDILFALGEIFTYKNWESFPAETVKQGLDIFHTEAIDLVLIDYHMPEINGMDGVKMFRNLSSTVPIVVLTVEESLEVADAFLEAGASDFALKPIKAPDLLSRLMVHLKDDESGPEPSYKAYAKGISIGTLEIVVQFMRSAPHRMTISKIAGGTGLAYQTVHRYLNHLAEHGVVKIEQVYGRVGRPTQYYSWK